MLKDVLFMWKAFAVIILAVAPFALVWVACAWVFQ